LQALLHLLLLIFPGCCNLTIKSSLSILSLIGHLVAEKNFMQAL
jgi:hypothetical protein